MGEKSESRTIKFYIGDQEAGELSMAAELPEITTTSAECSAEASQKFCLASNAEFTFTATMWTSCRTRKRFVKLMGGVFGMPRNIAERLAKEAMRQGCPSYMDLWADCYAFFFQKLLSLEFKRCDE